MRSIFVTLAICAFFLTALARGQTPPSEVRVREELEKNGIYLDEGKDQGKLLVSVRVNIAKPETLKAFALLPLVKDLTSVDLAIDDAKYAEASIATLKKLSHLKELHIYSRRFAEADLRTIVSLQKLEKLSLVAFEFSDAQVKVLRELKNAKGLMCFDLETAAISPDAIADLKRELAHVKQVGIERAPSVYLMGPVAISPKDDLIAKLQKQKFNAAIAAITSIHEQMRAGKILFSDAQNSTQFVESLRNLKNAALDLNDPIVTPRALDDYVQIAAMAHTESYHQWMAGKFGADKYNLIAYEYADAQLFQARRQKQLEKKAAK